MSNLCADCPEREDLNMKVEAGRSQVAGRVTPRRYLLHNPWYLDNLMWRCGDSPHDSPHGKVPRYDPCFSHFSGNLFSFFMLVSSTMFIHRPRMLRSVDWLRAIGGLLNCSPSRDIARHVLPVKAAPAASIEAGRIRLSTCACGRMVRGMGWAGICRQIGVGRWLQAGM